MALETGSYIDSLNAANPASTDPLSQADDHLRLIKSTLKATFPNVTGPVTLAQGDLNTEAAITSDGATPSLNTGITGAEVKTLIGVVEPAIASTAGTPSLTAGVTAASVRTLVGAASALDVYPVGCIYTTTVVTNPSALFGGTWVAHGAGRVLVGFASGDADFGSAGGVGGSKTDSHALTIDEMPAHSHTYDLEDTRGTGAAGAANGDSSFSTPATSTTGGGSAHSHDIIQPYLTVYFWLRTV